MPKSQFACLLLSLVLSACQEHAGPRGITNPGPGLPVATAPRVREPRLLTKAETRALLAPASPDLHRALALLDDSAVGARRMQYDMTMDPNDPATWPKTQITNPAVIAQLDPPAFAYAGMRHNGHLGMIRLQFLLVDTTGRSVQDYDRTTSELNPYALLASAVMEQSVRIYPPAPCGNALSVSGEFSSSFLANPFSIPVMGVTIPRVGYGQTYATASASAQQPKCEMMGGAPTGDPSPPGTSYYLHVECYSEDWFDGDGNYLFTVQYGCTTSVMAA